jgi:Bacterial regulatory proteins, luxR family
MVGAPVERRREQRASIFLSSAMGAGLVMLALWRCRRGNKRAVEISTAAGTGASLTPPADVYVRWQDHARSELAFVNNLLIGLAAGLIAVALAAGADVPRLRHIAHWERLCSGIGLVLTPRHWELLRLVAAGHTNAQIGRRLGVTERTVRKHLETSTPGCMSPAAPPPSPARSRRDSGGQGGHRGKCWLILAETQNTQIRAGCLKIGILRIAEQIGGSVSVLSDLPRHSACCCQ